MQEEDEAIGIPEWVVTFGDMMSLLLTFFIMLVSMSEIKEEKKYQSMVDSMRKRFGHDLTIESVSPGDFKARTSHYRVLSTESRAKVKDTHKGGAPTKAPFGDEERVRIIRPGGNTAVGTVVFFDAGSFEIGEKSRAELDKEVQQLVGKPQKIEIRGHTARQLAAQHEDPMEAMDLAYRRCRVVMRYLVQEHGIPPERIRCAPAGAAEPMYLSPDKMSLNPRVEVYLLEETVDEYVGTAEERSQSYISDSDSE